MPFYMFNSEVMITGFHIVGSVNDVSTSVHTLSIKECYLYGAERMVVQTTTTDSRTYIENCTIQSSSSAGTNGLVEINSGGFSMTSCQLTTTGTNSCLTINSTAQIYNVNLNTFTNDNVGSSLQPLVYITTPTGTHSIANCGFLFSKSTVKSTAVAPYNTGIFVSGRYARLALISNYFALIGTTVSGNVVNTTYAENLVFHTNNTSGSCTANPCAYLIGGSSKYALTAVS